MKREMMSFRRLILLGMYVLLIFSVLALIRYQNHSLLSRISNKANNSTTSSVQGKHVVNVIV